MALYKSELMTGGSPTETVLWTNSSPNSSFSTKTISLSQKATNFDEIVIKAKKGTSSSETPVEGARIKTSGLSGDIYYCMAVGGNSRGTLYYRTVQFSSNRMGISFSGTSASSTTGIFMNMSGSAGAVSTGANYAIPTEVIGVKY